MLKTTDIYIDLGTANTLIYGSRKGFLLNEPSILAINTKSRGSGLGPNSIFALGRSAKPMVGKTPSHLQVVRPLRQGVISDFDSTTKMLHAFIRRMKENVFWFRPRMIISLPCKVTQFEKRAVEEVGYALGARTVHLLDEPIAAAVGAGLPILSSRGQMIVDIGGGTTEIAILSLGGIVTSCAVRTGGDNVDDAIVEKLRSSFQFVVGTPTAERIKMELGNALEDDFGAVPSRLAVGGINLITGLPGRMSVESSAIFPAIDGVVRQIILAIQKALEQCPPEIAGDIAQDGIVLAGGGALLKGLPQRISRDIGLPVTVAKDPLFSVAFGGAKLLEDHRLFEGIERPA